MAQFNVNKSLDPKLRCLVQSMNKPGRLAQDRRRAFVRAQTTGEPTGPADHSKRVLVQIDVDEPPAEFSQLKWHRLGGDIYTVDVPLPRLEELATHANVKFVESGRRMTLALDTSLPASMVEIGAAGRGNALGRGAGVAIGIIDLGFDFTLDDFTAPDGKTRIAFLWDQSLIATSTESTPSEFGYGVEYSAADIDAARKSQDPFVRVRHRPLMGAHGTHVAGIAAGNGRSGDDVFPAGKYVGVADAATLILVQPGIEQGEQTLTDSSHVADAVDYIFRRAATLKLPCVINLSMGQNGGSHDGESVVERAIDRMLERAGRAVVVAAGNEHIWRSHASGTLPSGETRILHWRMGRPPNGFNAHSGGVDTTPNEMEIWYSSRDEFSVRVIDPEGRPTPVIRPDNAEAVRLGDCEVYVDSERFTVLNGDARIHLEVRPIDSSIPAGTWRVELAAVESQVGRFDAWIERDERNALNGYVDQSSFEDDDADGSMTLGTPATSRRAIAVANYNHRLNTMSRSSGRGPTRDGRPKPECSAPGEAIVSTCALGGRSLNGSVPPARIAISGTSMAAPHVAGVAALLFERGLGLPNPVLLSADQVRKLIMATTSEAPGLVGFDASWGFGRLNAEAAVQMLGPGPELSPEAES